MRKNLKKFIENARVEYNKIGFVCCPAFNNEKIYFNREGFRHLLRPNGQLRYIPNLIRKIKLLSYAVEVIKISKTHKTYQKFRDGLEMWSLEENVLGKKVTAIVRRDKQIRYFFSVMNE
jgi:hypothetical protein